MGSAVAWFGAVVAFVAGVVIGVVFTVAHGAAQLVGGQPWPVGTILGLAAVVAFLAGLRLVWIGRLPAIGGAVGLLAAIWYTAFGAPGHSALDFSDKVGWVWLYAPLLAAVVAVGWPRGGQRATIR